MRKKLFPNDKRVSVMRADGSVYRDWESNNLMKFHGWIEVEVRVMQSCRNIG